MNRRPPLGLSLLGLTAVVVVGLPLAALVARVPWSQTAQVLGRPAVGQALRLSFASAAMATLLAILLGVPLAWLLARSELPGRSVLRLVATLPLVLPPVVGGVALLAAFGRRGVLGRRLDEVFGVTLPFTPAGVVLAELFVAIPFVVITAEAGLRQLDERFEAAAATLGARRWTAFRTVALPLLRPSLAAGAALAFARALGEFGATITFAGSVPGRTETLPTAVYLALENDPQAALVLSALLMAAAVAVLVVLRGRWLGLAR